MKLPKLIFGDDNGSYSLWDITLDEYNDYRKRLDEIEFDDEREKEYKYLEAEFRSHEIEFNEYEYEYGYINGAIGYLAKALNIDVDSN